MKRGGKFPKAVKKAFLWLALSRGFSPVRLILTGLYIYALAASAPYFATSVGNYKTQVLSVSVFTVALLLLLRSVKRIFDERTRKKMASVFGFAADKIGRRLTAIGEKIKKAFGIGRLRGYGEERDFVFGERRKRGKRNSKLHNPLWWRDQEDSASRVRYIFTEYMIAKIKGGYRMRPSETPSEIEKKLADTDEDRTLFEAYNIARYSGGREDVDDHTVEKLAEHYGIRK